MNRFRNTHIQELFNETDIHALRDMYVLYSIFFVVLLSCRPPCRNRGTCYISLHSLPYCKCPSGYRGLYCQYRGNYSTQPQTNAWKELVHQNMHMVVSYIFPDCTPACQNGGTCQSSTSDAYCNCRSGYTGSYCQYRGVHAHLKHAAIGP